MLKVANLDISNNSLDNPDCIEDVLSYMPSLKVLILMGNPLVKKTINYRFVTYKFFNLLSKIEWKLIKLI